MDVLITVLVGTVLQFVTLVKIPENPQTVIFVLKIASTSEINSLMLYEFVS